MDNSEGVEDRIQSPERPVQGPNASGQEATIMTRCCRIQSNVTITTGDARLMANSPANWIDVQCRLVVAVFRLHLNTFH